MPHIIVGYKYHLGMHLILGYTVDKIKQIVVGEKVVWPVPNDFTQEYNGSDTTIFINAPNIFGGDKSEGGIQGYVDIMYGLNNQQQNSYLISKLGTIISAFRKLTSIVLKQVYVGTSAYPKTWSFLAKRTEKLTDGSAQWYIGKAVIGNDDLNPVHIIRECLTNKDWGLGHNESEINDDNFKSVADILYNEEFGLSLIWDSSISLEEFIGKILETISGCLYQNLSTGKWELSLARDNYNLNDLEIFDETDIIDLEDFHKPAIGNIINQITLNWIDKIYNKERSISVQDTALIDKQNGNIIDSILDYPGICNAQLANKIASRELKMNTSMLASIKLKCTRKMSHLKPNDVFKFSWPKLNISSMIVRVAEINYGSLHNNEIDISCIEDVFTTALTVVENPPNTSWESPVNDPINISYDSLIESPYYSLCNDLFTKSIMGGLNDNAAFLIVNAVKPTLDSYDFTLLLRHTSGLSFDDIGVYNWCPTATLKNNLDIDEFDIEIELENVVDLDNVKENSWALINNEIVKITSIDSVNNKITISRGVLDTIPNNHNVGSRVWFIDSILQIIRQEYTYGNTPSVKFLTRTAKGILSEGAATIKTVSAFNRRMIRPYCPGNLKINTNSGYQYYPEFIGNEGSQILELSWKHRDRTNESQLNSLIKFNDSNNYGPETGTTYTLEIYDKDNVLIKTETGLTGTSYSYTLDPKEKKERFELWSVRDGYDSFQIYNVTVRRYSLLDGKSGGKKIEGQSSISGNINTSANMEGIVQSQSSISGEINISSNMIGAVQGQSSVSGDLSTSTLLSGVVQGQSSISGNLFVQSGSTLQDYYNTGDDYSFSRNSTLKWFAQTFTANKNYSITSVKIKIYKNVGSSFDLNVKIQGVDGNGHPDGNNLASGTILDVNIPTSADWVECEFSVPADLIQNTKYAIVVYFSSGSGTWYWRADYTDGEYTGGNGEWSNDGGVTWTAYSNYDFMFETWGY